MTKNDIALEIAATKARLVEMERVAAEEQEKAAEAAAAAELAAAQSYDESAAVDEVRGAWKEFVEELSLAAYVRFFKLHEQTLRDANHARAVILDDRNRRAQQAADLIDRWHAGGDDRTRQNRAAEFYELTGEQLPEPDGRTILSNGNPALSAEQIPACARVRPTKVLEAVSREDGRHLPRDYRDAVDLALSEWGVR